MAGFLTCQPDRKRLPGIIQLPVTFGLRLLMAAYSCWTVGVFHSIPLNPLYEVDLSACKGKQKNVNDKEMCGNYFQRVLAICITLRVYCGSCA